MAFDGQSIVNEPGELISPGALAWPWTVMHTHAEPWAVVAINGTTYVQRATSVVARVDTLLGSYGGATTFVDLGGFSDIVTDGLTGAAACARAETYADARRAAGWDYIVGITQPHSSGMSGAQNTARLDYNVALKASTHFDLVIDIAADVRMQNGADTTYFSDGTHLTQAGADVVASLVEPALIAAGRLV